MKREHIKFLACPSCESRLRVDYISSEIDFDIESGSLRCTLCNSEYKIVRHVPRFTSLKNYSDSFGFQWIRHSRTQYDSHTGVDVSRQRFFDQTNWPQLMHKELILEVGCGSGRFTEQAASTGAMVLAIDSSEAVEANYNLNRGRDNVLIVQGNLYQMPFPKNSVDRLFCFGVLQHTPDPKRAFMVLVKYVKPGGHIAVDVYRKIPGIKGALFTKYLARRITSKMPPEKLHLLCERYIRLMWRFTGSLNKVHRGLSWLLLVADYRGAYPLSDDLLLEWAVLDTFDMLSPVYDQPQTVGALRDWFHTTHIENIKISYSLTKIDARGTKHINN